MRINQHPVLDPRFQAMGLLHWGIGVADDTTVRGQSHQGTNNRGLLIVGICSPYADAQKFAYHPAERRHLSYIEPFSWAVDYHVEVRKQLFQVQSEIEPVLVSRGILRDVLHQPEFCVDNNDNDDRAIAVAMGLGKLARNHLVIHPQLGSHFFIGYMIYAEFDLAAAKNFFAEGSASEFSLICEHCQKCVSACPTQALTTGVEHCLSYLTQFTGEIPAEKRPAFENRLYGCSECQRVCPYNRMTPGIAESYVDPFRILSYTNTTFKRDYGHMGFAWRALRVYKRNALINIGNTGGREELEKLIAVRDRKSNEMKLPENLEPYLDWAIEEIKKRIN